MTARIRLLIAIILAPVTLRAGLIHRYSFNETNSVTVAKDSAGNVAGKLKGSAGIGAGMLTLTNDASSSSSDSGLSYLEFESSILPKGSTNVSLVFWFTAKETGNFARLLNIGDQDGSEGRAFLYFTPHTGDSQSRAGISATDTSNRIPLDNRALDDGKPHVVVIVIDGTAKKMRVFVDGSEPTPAVDLEGNTLDRVRPVQNFIGKSSFDSDPGLNAAIDEFRVYDNAMSLEEVTAVIKAGPNALPAAEK